MQGVCSRILYASIAASASGSNTLVAAVASKKIRVLAAVLVATAAVTAQFKSAAAGSNLTGAMAVAANGTVTLPFNPEGWFETTAGELLNLVLGGAIAVTGCLTYVEVS